MNFNLFNKKMKSKNTNRHKENMENNTEENADKKKDMTGTESSTIIENNNTTDKTK